jgi:hypothetical protein
LSVFGYSREVSAGVAILAHGLVLALPSILGAIALAREGHTLSSLATKAQSYFRNSENATT